MLIALAGKTNVGKSTLFNALTLGTAEMSNRTFTTIKPNVGISAIRAKCPCRALGKDCGRCRNGVRFVPVKIIDIAGLVPGAHEGKGLGNQFLSDTMEAQAIIHVVDASGSTDINGNPVPAGTHNPQEDIAFFQNELDWWMLGIARKAVKGRVEMQKREFVEALAKQLTGLGMKPGDVDFAVSKIGLKSTSDDDQFLSFIRILREKSKPILIAANKADVATHLDTGVQCSAAAELALRRAAEKGMIEYTPGDGDFKVLNADEKQREALGFIRNNVLSKLGSTGVQKLIDSAVFDALQMIVVYPVENESRLSDKKGNVLPDAHLLRKGSTALDLAYRVHEDIGKKFIAAVNCRNGRNVSASYELQDGDVLSIKAGR